MNEYNSCPQCQMDNIYFDGTVWNCPDCGFEWVPAVSQNASSLSESTESELVVKDANGQILQAGDHVIVIKELKFKGSSGQIKAGTKVRGIRIQDGGDGHNIAGKIDGIGLVNLKSQFVRKA